MDPLTTLAGYGSGYGYGYGYGYGDGYGDGIALQIPRESAWIAYHYIVSHRQRLLLRSGEYVEVGDNIHEDRIEMCQMGLHASLCPADAVKYKPSNSVLTKVLIWGKVVVAKDKLVATDRRIVEIL